MIKTRPEGDELGCRDIAFSKSVRPLCIRQQFVHMRSLVCREDSGKRGMKAARVAISSGTKVIQLMQQVFEFTKGRTVVLRAFPDPNKQLQKLLQHRAT